MHVVMPNDLGPFLRRDSSEQFSIGTESTFLPRNCGPMCQLSTSAKYPLGTRSSTERMERLMAHATIRMTVKTVPMINPSGRSTQLSTRV